MKRFGAILLALALTLTLFPMVALAAVGDVNVPTVTAVNGIGATVTVAPTTGVVADGTVTVTVAPSGAALATGTMTVTINSTKAVWSDSSSFQVKKTASSFSNIPFTFTMPDPAVDVDDLTVTLSFVQTPAKLELVKNNYYDYVGYGYAAKCPITIVNNGGTDITVTQLKLTSSSYLAIYPAGTFSQLIAADGGSWSSNALYILPDDNLRSRSYTADVEAYDGSTWHTVGTFTFDVMPYGYGGSTGGGLSSSALTMTPSSSTYSGGSLVLSTTGMYNNFSGLSLNGVQVSTSDYSVDNRGGYAYITVSSSALSGVSGTARFTASFTNGSASCTVQVLGYVTDIIDTPPKTGDASSLMGITLALLACALFVAARRVRARAR